MKIYDRDLTGASAAETGRAQELEKLSRSGTSKSATRGQDGPNDHVEFSGTLSRLSRTLETFESMQAGRVRALAAQYQSGNYRPDASATSKGLVSEALSAGLQ
jgi:anti-sigma28 factor (negative regulator of flagellin synthesis)